MLPAPSGLQEVDGLNHLLGNPHPEFPTNRIPLNRFDPVALATLNYFPLPNGPGTVTNANNFVGSSANTNLLRNPVLPSDQRTLTRWFDTTAFADPAPFTFGNSPRSGLRGAPVVTTDATLEKGFSIAERWKFEIRGELYNLLNHANFNVPGFTKGAADFGVVSSARAGRTAQLSA